MKKLFLLIAFSFFSMSLYAQSDTLTLNPNDYVNTQILADTLANGSQAHVAYKVERGTAYAFDGYLTVDFPLTIVGPDNGPIALDKGSDSPAILVNTPAQDGTARQFFDVVDGGSLILKNLIISGMVNTGEVVAKAVTLTGGNEFVCQNVVWSDWQDFLIQNFTKNIDITCTDCVFINGVRLRYSQWGGMPFRMDVAGNNVIIENNTVVNSGRLLTNGGAFFNSTIHELHNTYINCAKNAHETRFYEMICANNFFINWEFAGHKPDDNIYDRNFTTWNDFASCAGNLDSISCYLGQNSFYHSPELTAWFDSDTIKASGLWEHVNVDSFVTLDDDYTIGTNYNEFDPGFTKDVGNIEKLVAWLDELWMQEEERPAVMTDWRVQSAVTFGNDGFPVANWPLPFDLSYSNEYLQTAGSDGLPIGDLNWFPEKKAIYKANRTAYIAALQDSIHNAVGVYVPGNSTPMITPTTVAVEDEEILPNSYSLEQNYPNPFNPTTVISFAIPATAKVTLSVYNVLGQEVAKLVNKEMAAGKYNVQFNASNLGSGIYFYTLNSVDYSITKKMMLIK